MRVTIALLVLVVVASLLVASGNGQDMVCNVLDYGAVGDNSTINTIFIQKAIEVCASAGGGQVLFPDNSGVFVTGAIYLRSNITFTIGENTMILGAWEGWNNTFELYPKMYTRSDGYMMFSHASLINAAVCLNLSSTPNALGDQCLEWEKFENVIIEGPGTIDGNGHFWWNCSTYPGWNKTYDYCPDGTHFASQRPSALAPLWVNNLTIRNLHVQNSGFWSIHPTFCNNLVVDNVSVYAPPWSENTDGCDPDSCINVTISNMYIDVGDDCIALNSGKDLDGRLVGMPTRHVRVENITCLHGHGLSIGSGMSGNITDVVFRNCTCRGTLNGPRVKTMRGRGGIVENVLYEDIYVYDITDNAVDITMYYQPANPTNASATPIFRNIELRNVQGYAANNATIQGYAGIVLGLPESPIYNITFAYVNTTGAYPWACCNAYGTLIDSPEICINTTSPPYWVEDEYFGKDWDDRISMASKLPC
eukprot:TRINITY_DN2841_c0_g1_i2.p1 TRINITY_DN2841_c0_g1~~TRINITY_DN2841_c0_g1_i2.p1  ORF type:complete len:496 (-),score=105.47 TRINITY_DN2841_c0_g1_i2:106-1536(-)